MKNLVPDKKDIHVLSPEQIAEPITEPQLRGFQFTKAPMAALTPSDGTLANAVIRIGQIEDRLIKLGLIQKT